MKTTKLITIFMLVLFISSCSNKKTENQLADDKNLAEVIEKEPVEASLFDRLGGTDGISSIVDDIIDTHMKNQIVNHLFLPIAKDPAHLEGLKKRTKEFLSAGTGGGATYTGKDLPSTHKGMQISEKEFLSAIDDILMVLSKHNIDEETKKDMLYILYSMKGAVIGK